MQHLGRKGSDGHWLCEPAAPSQQTGLPGGPTQQHLRRALPAKRGQAWLPCPASTHWPSSRCCGCCAPTPVPLGSRAPVVGPRERGGGESPLATCPNYSPRLSRAWLPEVRNRCCWVPPPPHPGGCELCRKCVRSGAWGSLLAGELVCFPGWLRPGLLVPWRALPALPLLAALERTAHRGHFLGLGEKLPGVRHVPQVVGWGLTSQQFPCGRTGDGLGPGWANQAAGITSFYFCNSGCSHCPCTFPALS